MSFIRSLITDLRERQVLPAVLLLVVLVIAIPVVGSMIFSKSSPPGPVSVTPVTVTPPHGVPSPATELATAQTPPVYHWVQFTGAEPNPFAAPASGSVATSSAKSPTSSSTGSSTKKSSTTKTSSSGGSTSKPPTSIHPKGSTGSGSKTGSTTPTGSTSPKPAPSSLSSDEVYTVNLATSYGSESGTLDNVERLTPLPPNVTAEVVFLGVMKGGKSAAFLLTDAIDAKTQASGKVTCVPSASDCEVIELPVGSVLTFTPDSSSSGISTFTLKVSAIGAQKLASASAAEQARQAAAAAGQALITASTSAALASFFYDDSIGALVYEPQTGIGSSGSTGTSGSSGASGATG